MKKILQHTLILIGCSTVWLSCKRDSDYIKSTPSSFISNFDLRKLYRGSEVTLNAENMRGATTVKGQVISDHSGNNLPSGLLIVQNLRTVGNGIDSLRGMAFNIGADATKFVPGDSVHIQVDGAVLNRVGGILQVTGKTGADVTKIASGKTLIANRGFANLIAANPERFDCTLLNIVKGTFNPTLAASTTLSGDKVLNDGTSNIQLHTEASASFANIIPPYSGNYKGIVFGISGADGKITAQHRLRTINDLVALSNTVDIPEIVISGFINDVSGGDGNHEYIQLRATKDINFAVTPFALVTSNNAGASLPTGVPQNGWATGNMRTYKFNLNSGTVSKGEFFYVGSVNKLINGASSTSIASSKWIKSVDYNKVSDRFNSTTTTTGAATTNLLANSGNAFGIAVFRGIEVTGTTIPVDVVWVHNGGSLYQAGAAPTYGTGFRIGNTDIYDVIDPITGNNQPYFLAGTNTQRFTYTTPTDQGFFYVLGGSFDTALGKWVLARSQTIVQLTKTSSLSSIEGDNATAIK